MITQNVLVYSKQVEGGIMELEINDLIFGEHGIVVPWGSPRVKFIPWTQVKAITMTRSDWIRFGQLEM